MIGFVFWVLVIALLARAIEIVITRQPSTAKGIIMAMLFSAIIYAFVGAVIAAVIYN